LWSGNFVWKFGLFLALVNSSLLNPIESMEEIQDFPVIPENYKIFKNTASWWCWGRLLEPITALPQSSFPWSSLLCSVNWLERSHDQGGVSKSRAGVL
jgi:hypothetical protein